MRYRPPNARGRPRSSLGASCRWRSSVVSTRTLNTSAAESIRRFAVVEPRLGMVSGRGASVFTFAYIGFPCTDSQHAFTPAFVQ